MKTLLKLALGALMSAGMMAGLANAEGRLVIQGRGGAGGPGCGPQAGGGRGGRGGRGGNSGPPVTREDSARVKFTDAVAALPALSAASSKADSTTYRTKVDALAKRAFMHLPGVTDEWVKTLEVEKIAGAQVSPDEDIRLIAALIQRDTGDSCCRRKMFDQPDQDAPNLADPDAPCLEKNTVAAQK